MIWKPKRSSISAPHSLRLQAASTRRVVVSQRRGPGAGINPARRPAGWPARQPLTSTSLLAWPKRCTTCPPTNTAAQRLQVVGVHVNSGMQMCSRDISFCSNLERFRRPAPDVGRPEGLLAGPAVPDVYRIVARSWIVVKSGAGCPSPDATNASNVEASPSAIAPGNSAGTSPATMTTCSGRTSPGSTPSK